MQDKIFQINDLHFSYGEHEVLKGLFQLRTNLRVEKLISYGRTPYHTFGMTKNRQEDEEKIARAMEITNVVGLKDQAVAELSGGQRQRVWITMALAQDTADEIVTKQLIQDVYDVSLEVTEILGKKWILPIS